MTNPIFGDLATYKASKARSDLRYTVQHHQFKMKELLGKMRKRQEWLKNAAYKLRFNDNSNEPARRIKDNADDLDRALDDIKSRLDNIQRELGDPTL